jgi:hypothetical protein
LNKIPFVAFDRRSLQVAQETLLAFVNQRLLLLASIVLNHALTRPKMIISSASILGFGLLLTASQARLLVPVNKNEESQFWTRFLESELGSMSDAPTTAPPTEFAPAIAVRCQNPFALCAFANCTVNSDGLTADCGCYSFPADDSVSVIRTGLIPDADGLRVETQAVCNAPESCFETPDEAPICDAIQGNTLWPGASMVSTFAPLLEEENGVMKDPTTGEAIPSWMCPAAPGRRVPICMLAPCVPSTASLSNPYNFDNGSLDQVCTCPMVEVSVDYPVVGGLQNPCSTEVPLPGDFVQAAAGPLLLMLEADPDRVEQGWENVAASFEAKVGA